MKLQEYTASAHNFEECMKCTICTAYCPVVPVNPRYPGPKQAGPDGERLRLKDPYFFNQALKYCLNCKRCEVVCPSGVKVADIIQAARIKYDHAQPKLRDRMLANTDFMGRLARPFAPIVNGTTALGVTKMVLDATFAIDKHRTFPKYSGRSFEGWLKRHAKEQAKFEKQVAYYHGCYVNYNYPQLGKDFVKVMNALGIGVHLLDKEKCCGVALIANGMSKKATKNAKHNVSVLQKAVDAGLKVLTTSSTCVMTIREEYPGLLQVDNSGIRDSLLLATRYIYQLIESGQARTAEDDPRRGIHPPRLQLLRHLRHLRLQERELRSLPGHRQAPFRPDQVREPRLRRLRLRNLQMAARDVHPLQGQASHQHPRRGAGIEIPGQAGNDGMARRG